MSTCSGLRTCPVTAPLYRGNRRSDGPSWWGLSRFGLLLSWVCLAVWWAPPARGQVDERFQSVNVRDPERGARDEFFWRPGQDYGLIDEEAVLARMDEEGVYRAWMWDHPDIGAAIMSLVEWGYDITEIREEPYLEARYREALGGGYDPDELVDHWRRSAQVFFSFHGREEAGEGEAAVYDESGAPVVDDGPRTENTDDHVTCCLWMCVWPEVCGDFTDPPPCCEEDVACCGGGGCYAGGSPECACGQQPPGCGGCQIDECQHDGCNDHNICTIDVCQGCNCTHENRDCNDGNVCNGTETCNPATGCMPGTPLDCDDENICNGLESCDPASGCVPGTPLDCDDGNVCNGIEGCNPATGCTPGTPLDCDDENICNGQETCNPASGCIPGTPLNCDDGNVCNGVESCNPGTGCTPGTPLDCDDENVCNGQETCDPAAGCVAGNSLNCDDGDACNGVETCDPVAGCQPGTPMVCDDGDLCTADACVAGQCVFDCRADCTLCGDSICLDCACGSPICTLDITPHRTGTPTDTVYLLPNDYERFTFTLTTAVPCPLYLVIADPQIAKLGNGIDGFVDWLEISPGSIDYDVQGFGPGGETTIEVRVGAPDTGPACDSIPLKVGGSITFEFDQLPTHSSYGAPVGPGQVPIGDDWSLPEEVQLALNALSEQIPLRTVMELRVRVTNADGGPMENMFVAIVKAPEDGFTMTTNEMLITQPIIVTDDKGKVRGKIRLKRLELDVSTLPTWRPFILVGHLAEKRLAGQLPDGQLRDLSENHIVDPGDHVFNGHLIRYKREQFPNLGGAVELGISVDLPHMNERAYWVLRDMFDGSLSRFSLGISSTQGLGGLADGEQWKLFDLNTTPPNGETLELLDTLIPVEERSVELPAFPSLSGLPSLIDEALPLFPNDPISELIYALLTPEFAHRYQPESVEGGDPIHADDWDLTPWTLVAEIGLGVIPVVGDGVELVNQGIHAFTDGEVQGLVVGLSLLGLSADLGTLVPWIGIPANAVIAAAKAVVKHLPTLSKAIVRMGGGGISGLLKFTAYISRHMAKYIDPAENVLDLISPSKLYDALRDLIGQLKRLATSALGLDYDTIGKAVVRLADRGRSLSNDAAEGFASFIKHGDGEEVLDDLLAKFPADEAGDAAAESVGSALSKTHRNELVDALEDPLHDPRGLERGNDAVKAATGALDPHLRNVVGDFIGPNEAIKSMEHFEAIRFANPDNLLDTEVAALKSIRNAMGFPLVGDEVRKFMSVSNASSRVEDGFGMLGGFFAKTDDTAHLVGSTAVSDAVRLDFPGGVNPGDSYAVLRTEMTQELVNNAGIPRMGKSYDPADPLDFEIPEGSRPYPTTGHGMTASKDGRLYPEAHMKQNMQMPTDGNVTVLEFKDANGAPMQVTITVDGVPQTASDWKLIPDANSPTGLSWEPVS